MISKRLLSLLLALVMVFSLAACGSSDRDDADKEDEKAEESAKPEDTGDKEDKEDKEDTEDDKEEAPDYNALVDALEDVYKNPDLQSLGKGYGGTLAGDAAADYMKAYFYITGGMDEDDIAESYLRSSRNLEIQDVTVEDLDEEEIAFYQDRVDELAGELRESLEIFEGWSDAELVEWATNWKSRWVVADEEDMSLDEAKKMRDDVVSAIRALNDAIDGARIDAAQRVTITVADADGETDDTECYFFLSDGKWFSDILLHDLPGFEWDWYENQINA